MVVDHAFANAGISLCVSEPVLAEYYDVLKRSKFSNYPDFSFRASIVLADIELRALRFDPSNEPSPPLKDPSDTKFIELANACQADFLITGNIIDFGQPSFGTTRVVSPREYWEAGRLP